MCPARQRGPKWDRRRAEYKVWTDRYARLVATHYEVLGVASTATNEEIARAYFRKTSGSRKAGFLRGSTQGRTERAGIEAAYAVLIDDGKRAAYDQSLKAGDE